jgi:hypothetical protein
VGGLHNLFIDDVRDRLNFNQNLGWMVLDALSMIFNDPSYYLGNLDIPDRLIHMKITWYMMSRPFYLASLSRVWR